MFVIFINQPCIEFHPISIRVSFVFDLGGHIANVINVFLLFGALKRSVVSFGVGYVIVKAGEVVFQIQFQQSAIENCSKQGLLVIVNQWGICLFRRYSRSQIKDNFSPFLIKHFSIIEFLHLLDFDMYFYNVLYVIYVVIFLCCFT